MTDLNVFNRKYYMNETDPLKSDTNIIILLTKKYEKLAFEAGDKYYYAINKEM